MTPTKLATKILRYRQLVEFKQEYVPDIMVFIGQDNSLSDKWQLRHTVMHNDIYQHFSEAPRIAYLILHMLVSLKYGVIAAGVGFHHCLTVFEMIFYAAKLEIDMPLQFFGK